MNETRGYWSSLLPAVHNIA
ncbi:hypothetical protein E2C01_061715 [Portunus trituberculatus]|uniref:Uncharacterized protein n=1 Tax=Portunus trituberculatus TaxID=210409 RepID=A0A5B7HF55_PORTR|nr:hypothetical protein [Portunus trituberculatus]